MIERIEPNVVLKMATMGIKPIPMDIGKESCGPRTGRGRCSCRHVCTMQTMAMFTWNLSPRRLALTK
jgi:hypothetical protein